MIFRLYFLRAAHSLPLAAFVIANQLTHPQFDLTDSLALALVLLFEAVGLVTVGDQYQTAVHDLHRHRTANLKACLFKPLPLKVYRGRGCGLVILRDVSHGVITFCFGGFIYRAVLLKMRLSYY
ncbi:hypothetical protein [Xenorhabdus doucetiae]|uniref:Putative Histidine kinase n=1 Tax=Xenorhabdus doucetiae TaxID=351671 RepID=A0A068QUH6_9GAMM|nr:hypothetical protein LY16_01872 [Xenorhabdus doucetiae]CDG17515.1 putative Histidine kinase [Xenorhabdus doucetiae]